jgi:hypothetical protein
MNRSGIRLEAVRHHRSRSNGTHISEVGTRAAERQNCVRRHQQNAITKISAQPDPAVKRFTLYNILGRTCMDPILALALVTFALVIGFLLWNRSSLKQHQETGGKTTGIGGVNDPMSGTTKGMRDPDEMRASLDAASNRTDQSVR